MLDRHQSAADGHVTERVCARVVTVLRALVAVGAWLFGATSAVGAESGAGSDGTQGLFASVQGGIAVAANRLAADEETLRSRVVAIDLARLDAVRDRLASLPPAAASAARDALPDFARDTVLRFNLFDDLVVTGLVEHTARISSGGYSLSGGLLDDPFGTMTLVVDGQTVAGTVRAAGEVYHIRSVDGGVYAVLQVEQQPWECHLEESEPVAAHDPEESTGSRASPTSISPAHTTMLAGVQTPPDSVIDVAVFYTRAFRNWHGGTEQARARLNVMVAETNKAYRNSGVRQQIELVHAEEATRLTARDDLRRVRDPHDGVNDHIPVIRDEVWADVVMLVSRRLGGFTTAMPSLSTAHAPTAYAVSGDDTHVFAHELGHLMGLNHDRYAQCVSGSCGVRVTPDAHGYVNQRAFDPDAPIAKRWYTVMAYPNQLLDSRLAGALWALRFSNPDQTYPDAHGDPMGVTVTPGNRNSIAVDGPANAARTLNITRSFVADYRPGRPVQVVFDQEALPVAVGEATTVTVRLNRAPLRDLVLPLAASSATGAWPGDYDLPPNVPFKAHETERTFTVSAVDDGVEEAEETVTLAFGTLPGGVTTGDASTVTVTLTDDDIVPGSPTIDRIEITSSPDWAYSVGDEIEVSVVFTRPVTVAGALSLALTVGDASRQMTFQAGRSANEVLVFTYEVTVDDADTDGVSIPADSLAGAVRGADDVAAALTHAAVPAAAGHPVAVPVLRTVSVDVDVVTLTFSDPLDERSALASEAFTVTVDGVAVPVTDVHVSQHVVTLRLSVEVSHGQDVTVSHASGATALRNEAGNPSPSFSGRSVVNRSPRTVYDVDADGLIEITTLAQLDAVRHDLDGDGQPAADTASTYRAAFPLAFSDGQATRLGCGSGSRCRGYELMAALDFDTNGTGAVDEGDAYWNRGYGWAPLLSQSAGFEATFNGNGYPIRNLYINRPSRHLIGLFGWIGEDAVLREIQLENAYVTGRHQVGTLVGLNDGALIASTHATGVVTGWGDEVGGLVGDSRGVIVASYANVAVTGDERVGGLVGHHSSRRITASYATGTVIGRDAVGGLVGRNVGGIVSSYANGTVAGRANVGGLVGEYHDFFPAAIISASYWDTNTSGRRTGINGRGQTTAQLQRPTSYVGLYGTWSRDIDNDGSADNPWDFGTTSQYPALVADFDGDERATSQEFGHQVRSGPVLTANSTDGALELSWTAIDTSPWATPPSVTYTVYRGGDTDVEAIAEGLSATTFVDTAPPAETEYQVVAVVVGGEVARSAWVKASAPPRLSALEVSPGRLTPDFDSATAEYTAIVPDSASSITVTPTAAGASATVTVDGTAVAPGAGLAVTVQDGTTITVRVTAPGGVTKDYTLTIGKQPLWTLQLVRGDPLQPFTTVTETNEDVDYRNNFLILERGSSLTPLPERLNVTVGGTATSPADYEFNNPFRTVSRKSDDRAQGARRITVKGDTDSEESETITFSVEIDQTWTATLTIVDDDLAVANTLATGAPTIDNQMPMLGQMLTANVGDIADADGLPDGAHFDWQWMRVDDLIETDISGAAESTYTVTAADVGMPLKVRASFRDLAGNDESRTSVATSAVRAGTVLVSIDGAVIGGDGLVNIAEKAAGFPIRGTVDADSTVSVTVGSGVARDATVTGTVWSLSMPPNAPEVTGTNVPVAAIATKAHHEPGSVSGSFTVDLEAPSANWAVPAALVVGEAIADIAPDSPSPDIESYVVQAGTLPQGLALDTADGTIRGTPEAANGLVTTLTIRLADLAGNAAEVALTVPAVAKGTQLLTGFAYSSDAATLRQPPPTVTAPTGLAQGSTLSYASIDEAVCTVDSGTGALTLVDIGTCTINSIASATDDYNEATATYAVQVSAPPDDTALTTLALTNVDIGPFSMDVFAYAATAPYAVSATTVTAQPRDARATVTITGSDGSVAGNVRTVPLGLGSNELSVLVTAADGETQAAYAVSVTRSAPEEFALEAGNALPTGLWSDGETLWVADWNDADVRAYALSTGDRRPDLDVHQVSYCAPSGLWSDGELMWVLDHCRRRAAARAYRLSDGSRQSARDLTDLGPQSPSGLWSDGETVWIMGTTDMRLYARGLSDGIRRAERDIVLVRDSVTWQQGLWMDEQTVWVGDRTTGNRVRAYRRADGLPQPSRDLTWVAPHFPAGLWSDGDYVWLTTWRGSRMRVGELPPASRAQSASIASDAGTPWGDGYAIRTGMVSLRLDGAGPVDLRALPGTTGVRSLSLRDTKLDDLTPLAWLTELESLDIGENVVTDLSPLSGMHRLRVLRADGNRITDLWPLAGLSALRELDLGSNAVSDLEALSHLAGLEVLHLEDNQAADAWPLSGLSALRVLSLGGDSAMDLESLRRLPALDVLYLHGAMPTGAATLEGLSGLRVLDACGTVGFSQSSASGAVIVAPARCVRLRDRN